MSWEVVLCNITECHRPRLLGTSKESSVTDRLCGPRWALLTTLGFLTPVAYMYTAITPLPDTTTMPNFFVLFDIFSNHKTRQQARTQAQVQQAAMVCMQACICQAN